MQICLGQQLNLFHICHHKLVSTSPSPERGAAPQAPAGPTGYQTAPACPALLCWTRWPSDFHQCGQHSPFLCKTTFLVL